MAKRKEIDFYNSSLIKSFGEQLRDKRKEKGLTQEQLSAISLVSARDLLSLELGQAQYPSLYIILSISVALDYYEWEFFSLKRL